MAEEPKAPVTVDPVAQSTATEVKPEAALATNEVPASVETPAAPATEETKTEEAVKPTEESKETAAPKEEVKPIYEGVLRYTPTGNPFKSLFGLKEKLLFFYGEEAVPADKLAHLIKPGKPDLKETVAWSSQTGKGLLYFVKHADQKASPKGAISLADIEEPKAVGSIEINFKLHGHQHDLLADSKAVRDGWLLSLKEKADEAKGLKEEITNKEGYKEQLDKLSKPAPVAAAVAKTEGSPKKSTDERAPRSEASKSRPAKDRSQSRGKIFAALRGKKEADAAKEEPKAEKAEKAEEAKTSTETPATEATAPVITDLPPTTTDTPATEGAATSATPAVAGGETETKAEDSKEAPKKEKTRRTSKFFSSFKGALSPSTEKKQDDLLPPTEETTKDTTKDATKEPTAVPETTALESAKEAEPAAEAAPATEAAAVAPAPAGEKTEETTSPTTAGAPPNDRRRSSFFGDVQSKLGAFRSKSEKKTKDTKDTKDVKDTKEEVKPAAEESKIEEPLAPAPTPAVAATPAIEETKAEEIKPTETTEATKATETSTKEPEAKPKKENKLLSGVTRSLSKAFRGDKTKKEKVSTPEKVAEIENEETKPVEEAKVTEPTKEVEAPKKEETKKEETTAAPNSIGDVVPEAVNVGTAPKPSATVQATA